MKKIFDFANNKLVIFLFIINIVFWLFFSFSWILFLLLLVCLFVFRKAHRDIVCDDIKAILSPIDGKILSIEKVNHKELGECTQIYIKNHIYDPSSIRAIANLQIYNIKQKYGLSLNDDLKLIKSYNEKIIFYATLENKKILFRIHKGSLDNKIKIFDFDDDLKVGEEIGYTLNGYVSILLPVDSRIHVNIGDEIKACSLLAYIS